jgi:hypothetical protein
MNLSDMAAAARAAQQGENCMNQDQLVVIGLLLTGIVIGGLGGFVGWHARPWSETHCYNELAGTEDEQFVAVMSTANMPATPGNIEALRLQLKGYKLAVGLIPTTRQSRQVAEVPTKTEFPPKEKG